MWKSNGVDSGKEKALGHEGEVERRGLGGQSRTLGHAACCGGEIYCCGGLVVAGRLWSIELKRRDERWQKELVVCAGGVRQTAMTVRFSLAEISVAA